MNEVWRRVSIDRTRIVKCDDGTHIICAIGADRGLDRGHKAVMAGIYLSTLIAGQGFELVARENKWHESGLVLIRSWDIVRTEDGSFVLLIDALRAAEQWIREYDSEREWAT